MSRWPDRGLHVNPRKSCCQRNEITLSLPTFVHIVSLYTRMSKISFLEMSSSLTVLASESGSRSLVRRMPSSSRAIVEKRAVGITDSAAVPRLGILVQTLSSTWRPFEDGTKR
eukprot:Amastigsp_a844140_30.p2 type:complete len:113 gc:universal Amastigsp_a844140_30:341-3(-)